MSTLGIGLIGCGGMGRSLGRQLIHVEGARLVGMADPSAESREKAQSELNAPAYGDAEELLAQPGIDAVLVASPPYLHREHAELVIGHGKHLFLEKPMAPSTSECNAIIAAAEQAKIQLMIGQVLRYYPTWSHVLELVKAGEVGAPTAVTITRVSPGWAGWPQPWRNRLDQCGGLLMEVNAHEIDFMCQIGGDVTRVYAEADHIGTEDPSDYPNLCFISLRFANGAVGLLHTSTVSALQDISGKVQGTEGTIFYTDGFGPNGQIRWARRDAEAKSIRVGELQTTHEQPVRKELRLFVEAVRGGTPVPVTAREGRRNVRIAEAAYESARTGHAVAL